MRIVIVTPKEWEALWLKLMPQQRIMPVGNVMHLPSINAIVVADEELRISRGHFEGTVTTFTEAIRNGDVQSIYKSEPAPDQTAA